MTQNILDIVVIIKEEYISFALEWLKFQPLAVKAISAHLDPRNRVPLRKQWINLSKLKWTIGFSSCAINCLFDTG